jgi:hypothetical protein
VKETAAAIAAYRGRDWDYSAQVWRAILVRRPGDGVAELYLARIERHATQAPPPDWDGTFDLDTK